MVAGPAVSLIIPPGRVLYPTYACWKRNRLCLDPGTPCRHLSLLVINWHSSVS